MLIIFFLIRIMLLSVVLSFTIDITSLTFFSFWQNLFAVVTINNLLIKH